jgi:predicted Fe-S protein YdhL (DUF1289 family)
MPDKACHCDKSNPFCQDCYPIIRENLEMSAWLKRERAEEQRVRNLEDYDLPAETE